jgi:hypothetical protein
MARTAMDQTILDWHAKRGVRFEPIVDDADDDQETIDDARADVRVEAEREQQPRPDFSSGVRKPLVPRPSPSAQMDLSILRLTGREPNPRRLR